MDKLNFFYSVLIVMFIGVFTNAFSQEVSIDKTTKTLQLLPVSTLYIDTTKAATIDDILHKKQEEFQNNSEEVLGFGYSPNFHVWVKVTLHNSSSKKIEKIIEYGNPLTTNVEFYSPDLNYKPQLGGIFHKTLDNKTLNPVFHISLEPNETKTYYLKTYSKITTLIVELKLWDKEEFYNKEIIHQIILALFFGAMFILGIYNLFIYFFTKDRSYLFYVAYIMGLIIHQLLYVGFASTYFLSNDEMKIMVELASVVVALPVFALGFFTKTFLETTQYKLHNKILNILLVLIPLGIVFFILTDHYDKFRNLFTMLLLIYLFYLTIYAYLKKNKQANFILFGWFVFVFTGMLMYLSSAGVFSIHKYFPYMIEMSFLLEAVIFSIALANRINSLQEERNKANQELIFQKKKETLRLEKTVQEKTESLTNTLAEKDVLLKELNHRVKNNMQTIISLIRLQSYDINDERVHGYLKTIQNRIAAMSHLHELLYRQDNLHQIKTALYVQAIADELQESYLSDINIKLDIKIDLVTEEAIYCGLIVNELVTNSIKYAFSDEHENPTITIAIFKENGKKHLEIEDNGTGYEPNQLNGSLGLTLVETLAVQQLDGEYNIDTTNGTKTTIIWKQYGED